MALTLAVIAFMVVVSYVSYRILEKFIKEETGKEMGDITKLAVFLAAISVPGIIISLIKAVLWFAMLVIA